MTRTNRKRPIFTSENYYSEDIITNNINSVNGNKFDATIPRSGKWTPEEERFAFRLIDQFESGSLIDCEDGCTLRSYLARKLNCAPMRISKKFAGKCIGKHVFSRRVGAETKPYSIASSMASSSTSGDTDDGTSSSSCSDDNDSEDLPNNNSYIKNNNNSIHNSNGLAFKRSRGFNGSSGNLGIAMGVTGSYTLTSAVSDLNLGLYEEEQKKQ